MTTLKTYHADEIASALDAQLKDESFVGLYKKADAQAVPGAAAQWWTKGPTAKAFKDKVDAAKTSQEIDAVVDTLNDPATKTKLGQEGISDETELQNYAYGKKTQSAKDGCAEAEAKDGGCSQHAETQDGCAECADAAGLAIAIDFATRHVVKVADALDRAGYPGVAEAFDETLRKLAAQRPIVVLAEKKKTRGRSYDEWSKFFGKKGPEVGEKFRKTYKGALEHAKEKGMGADKAEEYAMRTALDKMPKSYFKEPGKEHGPKKSGPLTAKRSK